MAKEPRNPRNFWIELECDGIERKVATGPIGRDGGFKLTVKMRDEGRIIQALTVQGVVIGDAEELCLEVRRYAPEGQRTGSGADLHVHRRR